MPSKNGHQQKPKQIFHPWKYSRFHSHITKNIGIYNDHLGTLVFVFWFVAFILNFDWFFQKSIETYCNLSPKNDLTYSKHEFHTHKVSTKEVQYSHSQMPYWDPKTSQGTGLHFLQDIPKNLFIVLSVVFPAHIEWDW